MLSVCLLGEESELTHAQALRLKMTSWTRWHARNNTESSDYVKLV